MPLSQPYQTLTELEPAFGELFARYGEVDPFVWHDGGRTGDSNFAAMALHITGQRISARVAFTVFDRISALVGGTPTPERIAAVEFDQLRPTGLSDAKTRYIQSLARAQLDSAIDLEDMADLDDDAAVKKLTAQPGIGQWSAEMFLIHQLHRADVLPAGDIGIRRSIQRLWQLEQLPTIPDTVTHARAWSPVRSYAAALLWRSLAPVDQLSDPKERELARQNTDLESSSR